MKKEDLKIGYLVECRNGNFKMLMPSATGNVLVDIKDKYYELGDLRNNLTTTFSEDFDIMKVYGFSTFKSEVLKFSIKNRPLLWERKDKKEMTISEIEKELGYSIKIIEEK